MLRELTKTIRRWIEKGNNRPRILYAKRSICSKVSLYVLFFYVAKFVIDSITNLLNQFVFAERLFFMDIHAPYFSTVAIIFGFVALFLWILLEFFDITFDDLITIIIFNLVFLLVLSSICKYIGSGIGYFISVAWHVTMFFYICPRRFFRVYSDYNSESN